LSDGLGPRLTKDNDMPENYAMEKAIMEAERNAETDAFFKARPAMDTPENRRKFEAGFERAWDAAKKQGLTHLIKAAQHIFEQYGER
jgi:hypothetical protein